MTRKVTCLRHAHWVKILHIYKQAPLQSPFTTLKKNSTAQREQCAVSLAEEVLVQRKPGSHQARQRKIPVRVAVKNAWSTLINLPVPIMLVRTRSSDACSLVGATPLNAPTASSPRWIKAAPTYQPGIAPVVVLHYNRQRVKAKGVTDMRQAGVGDVLQYVNGVPAPPLQQIATPKVAVFSAATYVSRRIHHRLHKPTSRIMLPLAGEALIFSWALESLISDAKLCRSTQFLLVNIAAGAGLPFTAHPGCIPRQHLHRGNPHHVTTHATRNSPMMHFFLQLQHALCACHFTC